jgi:hypothetical protein
MTADLTRVGGVDLPESLPVSHPYFNPAAAITPWVTFF